MITVPTAKDLILQNIRTLPPVKLDLMQAGGKVLANNVYSPVRLPHFNQSAMDGYAIRFADYRANRDILLAGAVAAGDCYHSKLGEGQAVRIFTGAAMPDGADTVVMQEHVSMQGSKLRISFPSLLRGANVRRAGEQIREGGKALDAGLLLNPAALAFLASMGISSVEVIPAPRVSIIVTGNELLTPGDVLLPGQVYESNSFALRETLRTMRLEAQSVTVVKDNAQKIHAAIQKAIGSSDLVLLSGGISVGDHDHVSAALEKAGVRNVFYKVRQRPGKPLYFGKYGNVPVFGLPGNPAAALTCFLEYVLPAINILRGQKKIFPEKTMLPIAADYPKKKGMALFLKGKVKNNKVYPLEGQASYQLKTFAVADALIYIPEGRGNIRKGGLVEVHKFPAWQTHAL